MPWGMVNVEQRRVAFVVRAAQGKETMTALCREFRICRASDHSLADLRTEDSVLGKPGGVQSHDIIDRVVS